MSRCFTACQEFLNVALALLHYYVLMMAEELFPAPYSLPPLFIAAAQKNVIRFMEQQSFGFSSARVPRETVHLP